MRELAPSEAKAGRPAAESAPAPAVLFSDTDCFVLDKPSGIAMHRGLARRGPFFAEVARRALGEALFPVHRLDAATSGAVILARSSAAARQLQQALQAEASEKWYLALARGRVAAPVVVDYPIPCDEGGARVGAVSEVVPCAARQLDPRELCLVWVRPRTGRFHQVRRHLKHLRCPVLGDANYGDNKLNRAVRARYGLGRLALHAHTLAFTHPRTGRRIEVCAPLPEDLAVPLARMGFNLAGLVAGRAAGPAPA